MSKGKRAPGRHGDRGHIRHCRNAQDAAPVHSSCLEPNEEVMVRVCPEPSPPKPLPACVGDGFDGLSTFKRQLGRIRPSLSKVVDC